MNIGKLYDQSIASTYDRDENGLLSGARALAFQQIETQVAADRVDAVLDLAVGTGESLIAMRRLFPQAQLNGIDLSEEMLRIAETKLAFNAIHDDVVNTGRHFAPGTMDLLLMHFLTTFIDGDEVVARTAETLRPGGYYSVVSSTFEAFPKIYALARAIFPQDFIRSKNPAPENTEEVVSYCVNAGLEIVAVERFTKEVSFADFQDFYDFGMSSGFFAHILCHLDEAQLAGLARIENIFPLTDHYCGSVVLARRPA
jgi:ubiquinone/menaquinone biosynthesis C-methylase UbiE